MAYVTFRDRAHRYRVIARMETDARMMAMFEKVPVDGKRMILGGFKTFVELIT